MAVPMLLVALMGSRVAAASASGFDDHFAVVLIDAQSERWAGHPFPLPRSFLARAIDRAREGGAKAVVLKFFLDRPSQHEDDAQLQAAIASMPVVLQARLDASETHPNVLPQRFVSPACLDGGPSASSGWLPLSGFAERASALGFVDFSGSPVPLFEHYKGRCVASLVLAMISASESAPVLVHETKGVRIGSLCLPRSSRGTLDVRPSTMSLPAIPLRAFLDRSRDAGVRGKVVVIGYDGPSAPQLAVAGKMVSPHRLFIAMFREIYNSAERDCEWGEGARAFGSG